MSTCACTCSEGIKLMFACGGAADVGEVTDRVARKLNREGIGKMFCTAGLGGRVPGILATTQSAGMILALDGCPLQCVKASLEEAGFKVFKHLKLWELGLQKGQTEVTDELVERIVDEARKLLA